MTDKKDFRFRQHPVQLTSLNVRQLSILAHTPPDNSVGVDPDGACQIYIGHSEYDAESHSFGVALRLKIGTFKEECELPFSLEIEITGDFVVDETGFPVSAIEQFARMSAPVILMPYLREQAYSLTAKCGFKPIILALTEVPVLEKQSNS